MRVIRALRKHSRIISAFLVVEFLAEMGSPMIALALTSGPIQPEFSSFEPVATTKMVNEFTGDFTYNLPLIEVPGPHGSAYPLSLSYHSGLNQEEEASWVGFGWTLNPGAINRSMRGFPDDHKGKEVKFHNKAPKNWTVTAGAGVSPELFGKDYLSLNLSASLRYNNYRGFGYNLGIGTKLALGKGTVNLGYSINESGDNRPSFSLQISPVANLNKVKAKKTEAVRFQNQKKQEAYEKAIGQKSGRSMTLLSSSGGSYRQFSDSSYPTTATPYTGTVINFSIGLNLTIPVVPVGVAGNIYGSYAHQTNVAEIQKPAYGYIYSSSAGTDHVMDYQIEKESEYNKRDVFLGIPFNMADNFMISGEGLGGTFRFHHKQLGHFSPRSVTTDIEMFNIGTEGNLGFLLVGGGVDMGIGKQTLAVKDWKRNVTFLSPKAAGEDEPVFARFNNDLGGEWGTVFNDSPIQPTFSGSDPSVPALLMKPNNAVRSKRSSYIGYNFNSDMNSYKSYSKIVPLKDGTVVDRTGSGYGDLIGEFTVVNEMGLRYNYALPVYNKNEKQLSYGVAGAPTGFLDHNDRIYFDNQQNLVGEESLPDAGGVYAGSYLLTEINSPDFLDRRMDGPTQDDFGGYTRFNYKNAIPGGWYKWRIPFDGLQYARNSMSDPMDDMGSKSEGERQLYYLQSIETKTHVAIFFLDPVLRTDGREAPANDKSTPSKFIKNPAPGPDGLRKLTKISIYPIGVLAKDPADGRIFRGTDGTIPEPDPSIKPLKTVYFEYQGDTPFPGNGLCSNSPNSPQGKLTLKRVYFEYNGISQTRISPYIFDYTYGFSGYPSRYANSGSQDVTDSYDLMTGGNVQNQVYNSFNMDAWGNYQLNGQTRNSQMKKWVDQTVSESATFDPATWHLKRITLPSGGQIHIQYEQDDYQYVQNQEAHVMANLQPSMTSGGASIFYVDLTSIMPSGEVSANIEKIRSMITKRYVGKQNKIYFKFLYKLLAGGQLNLTTCNAEFITGYATVKSCGTDGNGLWIELANGPSHPAHKLPKSVCEDYVRANRIGKLDPNRDCNINNGISDGTDAASLVRNLINMVSASAFPSNMCQNIDPANSYFRIPTSLPKKGGGLRVRRLLMFDGGLEGNPVLYGNHYIYKTKDNAGNVISSGVAVNEPPVIREENILTDFIARDKQDWVSKMISGEDLKQSEGPIGESIYPGASVGYSRVTIKNIHSGVTNPGFTVHEFYTARDFPIVMEKTAINSQKDYKYSTNILTSYTRDKVKAQQGFSFVLNNMHGQIRRMSSYSGSYLDVLDLSKAILVTDQEYEYFRPGEKVPVQDRQFGVTSYRNPGREVDVTYAQKMIEEQSKDMNVEVDLSVGFIPLLFIVIAIPFPTAIPSFTEFEGGISTHATSKVVSYPAIVKKVTTLQDGIYSITENQAFDEMSGRPVAVKSYDEMKGAYLAQQIPAGWMYPSFGAKASAEGKVVVQSPSLSINYSNVSGTTGSITFTGSGSCAATGELAIGDLLDLGGGNLYHISSINYGGDQIDLQRSLSASGSIGTGQLPQFTILRSGKNNMLQTNAGEMVFHNETASALSVSTLSVPEANRWIGPGASDQDGSLFLKDLNDALGNPLLSPLEGPYYHMNMSQYADRLPPGCPADMSDATIKDVSVVFKNVAGQVNVLIGSFDLKCGTEFIRISNLD